MAWKFLIMAWKVFNYYKLSLNALLVKPLYKNKEIVKESLKHIIYISHKNQEKTQENLNSKQLTGRNF